MNHRNVLIASLLGTGILGAVAVMRRAKEPGAQPAPGQVLRVAAGVFVAGLVLGTVSEFAPKPAAMMGALMLVGAATVAGSDAFPGLNPAGMTGAIAPPRK